MRYFARRMVVGGLVLAVLAGATGCGGAPPAPTGVTSDVDRARAQRLTDEPIMKSAVTPLLVTPGIVHSDKLGWDRTEVSAEIYHSPARVGPTPDVVELDMTTAAATLRASGWTIYWEMCLPPPVYNMLGGLDEDPVPMQAGRADGYEWLASGYKIIDGVSYWVLVQGALVTGGDAGVRVVLRAPNARDEANLFTLAPEPVAKEKACAEDGIQSTDVEQAGTPLMIREWWPFPGETHTRDPNLV